MTIYSAAITLILVMDPVGNIPVFLSILSPIETARRARIVLRESFIAFLILTAFLFGGKHILDSLNITEPALGIAGGIILFLIAIKMIFPPEETGTPRERNLSEPFIVPLAIPLVAGPSAIALVTLLGTQQPHHVLNSFLALIIASCVCTIILLFATKLRKLLGTKGLIAMERLMGMVLTTAAVQMFLNGLQAYFQLFPLKNA
jgi:multiple antibiotic resistance protein